MDKEVDVAQLKNEDLDDVEEEEEEERKNVDEVAQGRESFLKVYKKDSQKDKSNDEVPDLSQGIKFKREYDEEEDLESSTGQKIRLSNQEPGSIPFIQEIKNVPAITKEVSAAATIK